MNIMGAAMRLFFLSVVAGLSALSGAQASPQIEQAAVVAPAVSETSGRGFIADYGFTIAPLAFVKFCMKNAAECEAKTSASSEVEFTLKELDAINRQVNDEISPRRKPTDPLASSWTVSPSSGDCNDYAVTKRSRLIAAGWPSERLRLAAVITPTGQGHLVLVARINGGDMVLDNLSTAVTLWQDTKYDWMSMQSAENPRYWVAVGERGRLRQQKFEVLASIVK